MILRKTEKEQTWEKGAKVGVRMCRSGRDRRWGWWEKEACGVIKSKPWCLATPDIGGAGCVLLRNLWAPPLIIFKLSTYHRQHLSKSTVPGTKEKVVFFQSIVMLGSATLTFHGLSPVSTMNERVRHNTRMSIPLVSPGTLLATFQVAVFSIVSGIGLHSCCTCFHTRIL